MSKKETKEYYKRLRKKIYQDAYSKEMAKVKKAERTERIAQIKNKAVQDARRAKMTGTQRIRAGYLKAQRTAAKIQEKREKIGKKIAPYLKNLEDQYKY